MRLGSHEGVAAVWLVEAGAAASERVGVGVEYSQPSAATGETYVGLGGTGSLATDVGRQEERLLLGMVRARLAGVNRWGADIVGGAGILFQHHKSGGCRGIQSRCENYTASLHARRSAFAVGLDIPVTVVRHFEMVADGRAYFLMRGDHISDAAHNQYLLWAYEWRSSTRVTVGIIGRVVWCWC